MSDNLSFKERITHDKRLDTAPGDSEAPAS